MIYLSVNKYIEQKSPTLACYMYSEGGKEYEVMYVKSIKVKRIAALAGSLLIAGAGVAAATLTFGNTIVSG